MSTESTWHEMGRTARDPSQWKRALIHALPIALFVLVLFYYWFGVVDRYAIFLYGHLGATAFDEHTSSRYWMAGLVASGAVMVLYTTANWVLGRIAGSRARRAGALGRDYRPPQWWQVWVLCAPPLAIGIPAITMTANWPTLPPSLATACTLATLAGLALALLPGSWAAQHPIELAWLAVDGVGLVPILTLLHFVELPSRGSPVPAFAVWMLALGTVMASVVWLAIMTVLRAWRRRPSSRAGLILVAGLCLSYLLLPLLHHLLLTPSGYRYITAASNVFAFSVPMQVLVLLLAAILDLGVTRLRAGLALRQRTVPGNAA
jgi:hypothetical protein